LRATYILGNQEDLLRWIDDDRGPGGEISHQANLNGSANVVRGELFRRPRVEDQSAPLPFLSHILCRKQIKHF
jgi:hypothetical protein